MCQTRGRPCCEPVSGTPDERRRSAELEPPAVPGACGPAGSPPHGPTCREAPNSRLKGCLRSESPEKRATCSRMAGPAASRLERQSASPALQNVSHSIQRMVIGRYGVLYGTTGAFTL